jgi:predicted O-methyltransferase YrrM
MIPQLFRDPRRVQDTVVAVITERYDRWTPTKAADYQVTDWEQWVRDVAVDFPEIDEILAEPVLRELEDHIERFTQRVRENAASAPVRSGWSADVLLARTCYAACRVLKPDVVVETGVAYGVTSTFILQAMAVNERGRLISIDLPPVRSKDESAQFVGASVPEHLRDRWELHLGSSRRLLPDILKQIGKVDIFVHDSQHTYKNMQLEFKLALPHIRTGGMIISDDVGRNRAFRELSERSSRPVHVVQEERKRALFGIARF